MSEIIPTTGHPIVAKLQELTGQSSDQLREMLAQYLAMTAEALLYTAAIVRILEERGEDLSEIKGFRMLAHIRRIAYGQLLPEIVVRYAGNATLLQRLSALPLPDQQRVISGGSVEVIEQRDTGRTDVRRLAFDSLSAEQINVVFATDRIRSPEEQAALIARKKVRAEQKEKTGRVRMDKEGRGLKLGNTLFPIADILNVLSEESANDDLPCEEQVIVKMPAGVHRHLKILAAEQGATLQFLLQSALRRAGLWRVRE